jgi:hypothetical protein
MKADAEPVEKARDENGLSADKQREVCAARLDQHVETESGILEE